MEVLPSDEIKKKRILVVEDTSELALLLTAKLQRDGFAVKVADSGEAALKLLAEHRFDLVLLDIMLPRIDGFDVCARIRANEKTKNLPVIFTSGFDVPDIKERVAKAGGNELIMKPIEHSVLLSLINKYLS